MFVACLLVHIWRRDYLQWPFPAVASLATLFVGFLLPHGNFYYTPFWYFPSFLLVFLTVSLAWRAVALPAFVLLLFVPQTIVKKIFTAGADPLRRAQCARARVLTRLITVGRDRSHHGPFHAIAQYR